MTIERQCALTKSLTNLGMVGGGGSRLYSLTRYGDLHQRAKPAVRVLGKYRIIDFLLSNLKNSGCSNVSVLLQYGAQSLSNYLSAGWGRTFETMNYVYPQQATLGNVFQGTADAVRQTILYPDFQKSQYVGIWAGDHITKFNVNPFLQFHVDSPSRFTIAVMLIPIERADQFGIVVANEEGKVIGFQEKPGSANNPDAVAKHAPGNPEMALASLGNYIVDQDYLIETLNFDPDAHDFGNDIIPSIIDSGDVYVYDMGSTKLPGGESFFWEDVGTTEAYHRLHMQMLDPIPPLNLLNEEWEIGYLRDRRPPARGIGFDNKIGPNMMAGGCQYEGSEINYGVIGRNCDIRGSHIDQSILYEEISVGKGCDLHRVIIDKDNDIPPGTTIGRDHEKDAERGLFVDESGIVIVPRYFKF